MAGLVMAGLGAHRDRGGEPRPRALCEKLPTYASPLLLYAQEIDPHTGGHLGNFPRPSRTWALINACAHLIREDERIAAG
jgi:alpha,alpha-trehalase